MADVKLLQISSNNIHINNQNENDPKLFEFYRKRCDVLEKDLFISQTKIKKLELSIRKSQDMLSKNACV